MLEAREDSTEVDGDYVARIQGTERHDFDARFKLWGM